jgi:hypothetical protein
MTMLVILHIVTKIYLKAARNIIKLFMCVYVATYVDLGVYRFVYVNM